MQVISAESTELFVGPADTPVQLARVTLDGVTAPVRVRVDGDGLHGSAEARPADGQCTVEVPVTVEHPVIGQRRPASVHAGSSSVSFDFVVAEPGWTMFMVSHFHYDPVWWNTQGAYTSLWTEDPPGRCRQTNAFELIAMHLERARQEPEYKFVLAEVDYLKPFWDTHPQRRAELRRLIADGRVEIMGGTYNEPSTNLVHPETTIRTLVHGFGFQRDVLGANPATAWQLDVFGHDPQFPGMAADAGLTSSAWARGPHHQWGPTHNEDGVEGMQFSSEFEWVSPSGRGLLTHYMPAHYAAGWWMDESTSLADAEDATYRLFDDLKKVALTRNVLLPVGTDYTPPNRWVTEIHRDWAQRYTWPRFVCALPNEFFAAVRAELTARGREASPQTRDMNPIYTGCHVSYIDTKQANRAAEHAVLAAEKFAVFAALLSGSEYPQAALAKAWLQLVYGAHHDAITGSESDQVYLDLVTGWREAWELGRVARDNSLAVLSGAVDAGESLIVWNPLVRNRTDIATVHLDEPVGSGVSLVDADGIELPVVIEDAGHTLTWLARDVPSLGWRAYRVSEGGADARWKPLYGNEIANDHYRLVVDPARGGGVSSLTRGGHELIAAGRVGNELAVYQEYAAHPREGEGPWHLVPNGAVVSSSESVAEVSAEQSAVGQRITVRGRVGTLLRYTQTLTLWRGVDRVDCQTTIDDFRDADQLLRLRWPCPIPGAMPVSEVGDAVVGRGFALLHNGSEPIDSARHPWTLDNAAFGWFGLSSAARVRDRTGVRALSVAEVVVPAEAESGPLARKLTVALARAGVTATCSGADRPRYGYLGVDSNLPDVRVAVGGPGQNAFTKTMLATADPAYAAEIDRQLTHSGRALVWVPATASLVDGWIPGADLRDPLALPVLVIATRDDADLAAQVAAVAADLDDAEISIDQQAPTGLQHDESRTVALFNRGVPSFAVDIDGTLHSALMRSCTGWPSRAWIDEPRRTGPDGCSFQLQHWTHTFDYALAAGDGDWRAAAIPARSAEFSEPMLVTASPGGTGPLPAAGSLLEADPVDGVHVGALKPAGNPLARNSAQSVDPAALAIRLVETSGRDVDAVVRSALGTFSDLRAADLLETPRPDQPGGRRSTALQGYQISTELARFDLTHRVTSVASSLGPNAEAAQPLYACYWLHNNGPAPLGGLPVVAHLHPHRVAAEDGVVALRLTVASDCTDASLGGSVTLLSPPGWSTSPAELPVALQPGAHSETDVAVHIPPNTGPGLYPIRAQLRLAGAGVPASWQQVVEDVCVVSVGGAADDGLAYLIEGPSDVEVAAGESARIAVTVGTDAGAELNLQAHLVSPWGTWEWTGPAAVGAVLPARGRVEIGFDVRPPVWVQPGQWWALIRVGCAGQLVYSPAVKLTVR
ncbi:NEW3 domain-containing protein [Mycobacterium sp.]|uniref:glycoside hydrolase family 38 N-terminal domain-containing protein n=1 Tax=Mycobacterium sp. TaxID=1785 RepID=UPI0025F09649|nr:NEW3 domain-containing protein [Mycobacterium sp.]